MSIFNQPESKGFGNTLTGGVQEVSAILPILGTEQCEKHVGSALRGGYFYAASTPLSIFGCLGIVKAGIAVLISSITIRKIYVYLRDLRPSGPQEILPQSLILGARMLKDAGFELQGDVAPLIGMDGTLFKAETRLMQILQEKHIDDPDKVFINSKSINWNIMLVFFTVVAAALSSTPYIVLLLGSASWRPTTHQPWLSPFLRTVGSCFASVLCQFIIQLRIISSMKCRILFMTIHRQLADGLLEEGSKANLDDWLKHRLQWDSDIPAEQCIYNLQRFLDAGGSFKYQAPSENERHVSVDVNDPLTASALPNPLFKKGFEFQNSTFQILREKHFPSPTRDRVFFLFSWFFLLLSLPATAVGYVGCFTLVGSSSGKGPLVWLGVEVALSIFRIGIWAWNPLFDEKTEITVELKSTEHQPLVTTEEHDAFIYDRENKITKPLPLIPETQFLETIRPFTGYLARFTRHFNIALYFTLTADYASIKEDSGGEFLLLSVFDTDTHIAVTFLHLRGSFYYFDADVEFDTSYNGMIANLQFPTTKTYSWQAQNFSLFACLEEYYNSVVHALNGTAKETRILAELKWNFSPKPLQSQVSTTVPSLRGLTDHDRLYLDRGYEHDLKTKLVGVWSGWIVENMERRANDAKSDCYEALQDVTSEKAKWELTELDRLVGWEWVRRELVLLISSIELEEVLRSKMETCIAEIYEKRMDGKLKQRMTSGFEIGRRRRLEKERAEAMERMTKASERAKRKGREGRAWKDQEWRFMFGPQWQEGIKFIDTQWSEGMISRVSASTRVKTARLELGFLDLIENLPDGEDETRHKFVKRVKQRFTHWDSQRDNEQDEMDAAIKDIRNLKLGIVSNRGQMDDVYTYPEPDKEAAFKFARLRNSSSNGKACSAIVYSAERCSAEVVCDLIQKKTTRSLINVVPKIIDFISPNDHLLFLSCRGRGKVPDVVQPKNRIHWWNQQETNSSMFYFTPTGVTTDSCHVSSGPIAQIFILIKTPSRVRLRLLHRADKFFIVSIKQTDKVLCTLSDGIPKDNFKLQDLELGQLADGEYELQLVAAQNPEENTHGDLYYLRDIVIEFFDDPAQVSSASTWIKSKKIGLPFSLHLMHRPNQEMI